MSILIIDDELKTKVSAVVERAQANPIPLDVVKANAVACGTRMTLEQRVEPLASETIIINGHYRCAFSFEHQPAGLCRHLSISVPSIGNCPNFWVVGMIAELFGFTKLPEMTWQDEFKTQTKVMVWLEEFEKGHHAVNLVQPIPEGISRE